MLFVYCEQAWHCFIQTMQQLFSYHKFKMSVLYTALVCVCSVSDCWLKHFTIQASCWLKDPLKLLKEKGLRHHQSFWLQSVASRRQHLERIRCKTPVTFRNTENNNKKIRLWQSLRLSHRSLPPPTHILTLCYCFTSPHSQWRTQVPDGHTLSIVTLVLMILDACHILKLIHGIRTEANLYTLHHVLITTTHTASRPLFLSFILLH